MHKPLSLHEMVLMASRSAEQSMRDDGRVLAIWHVQNAEGTTAVLGSMLPDKDHTADVMRRSFAEFGAVRSCFVDEVWYLDPMSEAELKQLYKDYYDKGKGIVDHPKRREAVAIFAEDQDGNRMSAQRSIIRDHNSDPNSKPTLGPLKLLDSMEFSGRFVGLLPPKRRR